jgi:hypothetical protein
VVVLALLSVMFMTMRRETDEIQQHPEATRAAAAVEAAG